MSFNIESFRSNGLQLGGVRPNQFELNIYFPFASNNSSRLSVLARAASIPPMIVDDVPVYYYGRPIKYAGDRSFPDWEITVYNDEDYALRLLFENWSNRINTLISNRMDPTVYATGYKVDGDVTQFGKDGHVIRTYQFVGLWPKVVEAMPVDWSATNQIQEFNVTLAYDYWVPVETSGLDGDYSPTLSDDQ